MSLPDSALQPSATDVHVPAGDAHAPQQGQEPRAVWAVVQEPRAVWTVDRPIPAICTDADLMTIIPNMTHSAFYPRKARGEFAFLELRPQLPGSNTRYSGHLLQQWLRGELVLPGDSRRFLTAAKRTGRPKGRATVHAHGSQPTGSDSSR